MSFALLLVARSVEVAHLLSETCLLSCLSEMPKLGTLAKERVCFRNEVVFLAWFAERFQGERLHMCYLVWKALPVTPLPNRCCSKCLSRVSAALVSKLVCLACTFVIPTLPDGRTDPSGSAARRSETKGSLPRKHVLKLLSCNQDTVENFP